jgi:hypothetical protein
MKTNRKIRIAVFGSIAAATFLLAGCNPQPAVAPTDAFTPSDAPKLAGTGTPIPAPTTDPLPPVSLSKGDFYFTVNGKPAFFFSRNLAGIQPSDYETLLRMTRVQGDLLVRVGTDNGIMGGISGYGYNSNGDILADWSANWEKVFTTAESYGIYVMPFFTGWSDWNTTGFSGWKNNPFNSANGGPAATPTEIFKKDSPTQRLYLKWFKSVVARWQTHRNILAWETVTEVNLINNINPTDGMYFVEQLAKAAREADPRRRPVTASQSDYNAWPALYRSDAVDFINFHPYPDNSRLDTYALEHTRKFLSTYQKPVLIGESGLHWANPDTPEGKITAAQNARIGIQHAIWAEMVSGSMNGRGLWWEDGYGIYFAGLSWSFLQKYSDVEAAAARFIRGTDMTGFRPVTAQGSGMILGAALGNDRLIIGWYRDRTCEPPDWNMQPVISQQTVTVTVPNPGAGWGVKFYDTKTGNELTGSGTVTATGNAVVIPLPDFKDDIAFKLSLP